MHGDLEIQIFFFASAFLAGVEAMKAEDWRRWAFWGVCGLFAAIGFGWYWLKGIYPPVTGWVTEIATSPQSWFVLIVLGLVLLAITGRKSKSKESPIPDSSKDPVGTEVTVSEIVARLFQIEKENEANNNELRRILNDVMQKQALLETQFKQAMPSAEMIRQLNRTALLLSISATDTMYRQRLNEALANDPKQPADFPIDTDDKMSRETGRLNEYLEDVAANLMGSRWGNELANVVRNADVEADNDLLRMTVPQGLHPARYRLFHIANMCRDRTKAFLERSITEATESDRQMLQMLRDRPQIHK